MANGKATSVEAAKTTAAKKVEETKTAVKTAAKAVEAKAEEVKTEVKAEVAKAEEKGAAKVEKKKPGRKPGTTKSKPAKAAKKEEAAVEIYVQYGPGESSVQTVVEKIKAEYVEQGHRASSIKSLKVYLKPEDSAAYYVINDKVAGRVNLF